MNCERFNEIAKKIQKSKVFKRQCRDKTRLIGDFNEAASGFFEVYSKDFGIFEALSKETGVSIGELRLWAQENEDIVEVIYTW